MKYKYQDRLAELGYKEEELSAKSIATIKELIESQGNAREALKSAPDADKAGIEADIEQMDADMVKIVNNFHKGKKLGATAKAKKAEKGTAPAPVVPVVTPVVEVAPVVAPALEAGGTPPAGQAAPANTSVIPGQEPVKKKSNIGTWIGGAVLLAISIVIGVDIYKNR